MIADVVVMGDQNFFNVWANEEASMCICGSGTAELGWTMRRYK